MTRQFWVWLHRWAGLAMTVFLVIVGLTGSVLAFREELDVWLNPELLTVPSRAESPLDPTVLVEKAAALYPQARFDTLPLNVQRNRSVEFSFRPEDEVAGGPIQFYLDPYTGEKLGERHWGEVSLAKQNIVSFLYRLHMTLALPNGAENLGRYILGVTALVWTIDCFVSFSLTLPLVTRKGGPGPSKSWRRRWKPAWLIKLNGGAYRINFDIHRAFGLWTWAMLFVFAWSSVAFNLDQAYKPVMSLFFDMRSASEGLPILDKPLERAGLSWSEALARGRTLMAETSARRGFRVLREEALQFDRDRGVYLLYVLSSWDSSRESATALAFDANTGEFKRQFGTGSEQIGTTITFWLAWLHMARVFGLPMQIFVCAMGFVISALSVTGVVIWLKKRCARRAFQQREKLAPDSNSSDKRRISGATEQLPR